MAEKKLKLKKGSIMALSTRRQAQMEQGKQSKMIEWTTEQRAEITKQAIVNGFCDPKTYIEALLDLHIKNPAIYKKYA